MLAGSSSYHGTRTRGRPASRCGSTIANGVLALRSCSQGDRRPSAKLTIVCDPELQKRDDDRLAKHSGLTTTPDREKISRAVPPATGTDHNVCRPDCRRHRLSARQRALSRHQASAASSPASHVGQLLSRCVPSNEIRYIPPGSSVANTSWSPCGRDRRPETASRGPTTTWVRAVPRSNRPDRCSRFKRGRHVGHHPSVIDGHIRPVRPRSLRMTSVHLLTGRHHQATPRPACLFASRLRSNDRPSTTRHCMSRDRRVTTVDTFELRRSTDPRSARSTTSRVSRIADTRVAVQPDQSSRHGDRIRDRLTLRLPLADVEHHDLRS